MKHVLIKAALGALLAAVWAGAPAGAAEQDPAWDMGRVVVSARSLPSDISDTPGGVGVATEADLDLASKASIAEALSIIPGVTQAGDSVWGRDISIRGLSGTSLLVLVDGKRINTATDLNARLGFINPMDVERVEVLKGPVSSLYGSGSIGGVVNIITRKGRFEPEQALHGRVSLGGVGNPAGADAYGNLSYSGPNLWLMASVAARDHDDIRDGDGDDITNSQFRDEQVRLAGAAKLGRELILDFQLLHSEAHNVGIPGGPSTLPSAARVTYPCTSDTLASLGATWEPGNEVLKEVSASVFYNRNQRRVLVDQTGVAAVKAIKPGADHQTVGGKAQTRLEAGSHSLVAGVDAWSWHMDSWRFRYLASGAIRQDTPVPESRQTSLGVFAEDDWSLGEGFTLNLGGRLDRLETDNEAANGYAADTQVDTGWNLHAGLTYRPGKSWSHTLLAASSYRVADILDRFRLIDLGGGQQIKGDPELDPETSLLLEYGMHYQGEILGIDLRVFANTIYDYISQKRQSPTLLMMHNVGEARIQGAELEGRWRLARDWTVFATLAGLDGRDLSTDQYLPDIAPVSGRAGVTWQRAGFWGRVQARWALDQNHTPDEVEGTDGYATLDAALRYRLPWAGMDHQVTLSLDNILNRQYQNYLANSRGIELYEAGFSAALMYTVDF